MENGHSRILGRLLVYDKSPHDLNIRGTKYFIADGGSNNHVFHGVFDTRKPVAVKRIQLPSSDDEKFWEDEAHLLLKLSGHPNMLKYYGTEKSSDFFYIATELCKGTLEDFVKGNQDLRIKYGREVLHQATRALAYLHEKNVVHRDIKPGNILIAQDYGFLVPPRIKLADFGLSILLGEGQEDFENTDCRNDYPRLGTHGWRAPELKSEDRCSLKIDIFSLGLVFVYTLSRDRIHPFGSSNEDGQNNINSKKPMTSKFQKHFMEEHPSRGGVALKLIMHMVHMNPVERWTVEKVLRDKFFQNSEIKHSCMSYITDSE